MLSNILLIFSSLIAIGWSFPFIIAPLIGLQFYIVSEQKVIKLLKKLPKYSSLTKNDEADGWIVGNPFIGYIFSKSDDKKNDKELYIFTSKKFFETKMKEIDSMDNDDEDGNGDKKPPTNIRIYEREGTFYWFHYSKREFDIQYFDPRPEQKTIIDNIIEYYDKNRNCIVILHGEKGMGKSMIPLLLAKTLSNRITDDDNMVNYCDTYKPTDPGDQFTGLYNSVMPTKHSPLVVVMEEFDTMITMVHHNIIKRHENTPTQIYDKSSWNQFFDRFDRKYFPWVILVMTSNMHPDHINSMDQSYIREGRVNLTFEVKKNNLF
jgi:hypothetical protein